jgi:hypothetical protein
MPDSLLARRRPPTVIALVTLCAVPAMLVSLFSNAWSPRSYATNTSDALVFRVAAEMLLDGRSPYDDVQQARHVRATRLAGEDPPYTLPFAYPPNALPLIALCGLGSPRAGFLIFNALGLALMLSALYLFLNRLNVRGIERAVVMFGTGVVNFTLLNAYLGQTGTYLAAAVFAYAACVGRAPVRAGVFLGLLAFKPQYALPLGVVALAEGRWKTVASSAATLGACVIISGLLFGLEHWSGFVTAVGMPNHTMTHMCSWVAAIPWLPPELRDPALAARIPLMLGAVAVLGALALGADRSEESMLRRLSVVLVVGVLVSPNSHPYDLIIWVLPVLVVSRHWRTFPPPIAIFGFVLAALVVLAWNQRWLFPLLGVALWAAARRPRRSGTDSPTLLPEPASGTGGLR